MIRSHEPRGFIWNCASTFQQSPEFRNIQYEDCVAPPQTVAKNRAKDEMFADDRAGKRRRVSELANDFLNGTPLEIHTARCFAASTRVWSTRVPGEVTSTPIVTHVSILPPSSVWVEEPSDREVFMAACRSSTLQGTTPRPRRTSRRTQTRLFDLPNSRDQDQNQAQAACRPPRRPRLGRPLVEPILESSRPTPELMTNQTAPRAYEGERSNTLDSIAKAQRTDGTQHSPTPAIGADGKQTRSAACLTQDSQSHSDQARFGSAIDQLDRNAQNMNPRSSATATRHDEHGMCDPAAEVLANDRQGLAGPGTKVDGQHVIGLGHVKVRRSARTRAATRKPLENGRLSPVVPERAENIERHFHRAKETTSSPFVYRMRTSEPSRDLSAAKQDSPPQCIHAFDANPPGSPPADVETTAITGSIPAVSLVTSFTPVGDQHLNKLLPKDPASTHKSQSLRNAIRAEWRQSGAEIYAAHDMPTSSQPEPDQLPLSDAKSPLFQAINLPEDLKSMEPIQTPQAETQSLFTKARRDFFASSHKRSLISRTQTDTSSQTPLTCSSSQPLPRRPLQYLPQESLPGTQTVLDGWTGFSTIRKSRTMTTTDSISKSQRRSSNGSVLFGVHDDDDDTMAEASPLVPRMPRVPNAPSVVPSASAPAGAQEAGDHDADGEHPSFAAIDAQTSNVGTESQNWLRASGELVEDHFGEAVAFRAVMSQ